MSEGRLLAGFPASSRLGKGSVKGTLVRLDVDRDRRREEMGMRSECRESFERTVMLWALVVACACLFAPAHAQADGKSSDGAAATQLATRHRVGSSLEDRVRTLTKALDLDARQQAELKKVLEAQRDEVTRIWDDESMPPANRVVATQAVSDTTADRIRALLNDQQKKKYTPPKQPHEPASDGRSVEEWMDAANPK